MFEFNGETYYKVFEVGKIPSYMDPKKRYNEDYIFQVAINYDPVNVHEAPFWVGHPEYFSEPRAGGWIKKVLAVGKELYVSFSQIMPWMKDLFDSGEFKKCSVEMGDLEINSEGESIPYLWALGATNIPAVKGLPALKFSDQSPAHKLEEESKLKNKVSFSLMNFEYKDFKKPKAKPNMSDTLKKLADSIGVKYSDETSETELASAIETKTAEIKAAETQALKDLNDYKDSKAVRLVDDAVKAGKIIPADKDHFESFAKSNFEQCEKILASLPEKDLTGRAITATETSGKFKSETKSDVTYEDLLRSPDKFIGVLSEEEILKLRENSNRFKDVPILD